MWDPLGSNYLNNLWMALVEASIRKPKLDQRTHPTHYAFLSKVGLYK